MVWSWVVAPRQKTYRKYLFFEKVKRKAWEGDGADENEAEDHLPSIATMVEVPALQGSSRCDDDQDVRKQKLEEVLQSRRTALTIASRWTDWFLMRQFRATGTNSGKIYCPIRLLEYLLVCQGQILIFKRKSGLLYLLLLCLVQQDAMITWNVDRLTNTSYSHHYHQVTSALGSTTAACSRWKIIPISHVLQMRLNCSSWHASTCRLLMISKNCHNFW